MSFIVQLMLIVNNTLQFTTYFDFCTIPSLPGFIAHCLDQFSFIVQYFVQSSFIIVLYNS